MKAKTLSDLEQFMLSDRVTIKGSEVLGYATMLAEVQAAKAEALNLEMIKARARPVAVAGVTAE